MTVVVRMTFKDPVDRFVKRSNLVVALLQSKMPWPLAIDEKKLLIIFKELKGTLVQ